MARDFSAELFGSPTSGQGTDFSKELFGSKPKERTYGEAFTDVGAGVVSGIGSLVQLPGQLYGLATGDFEDTGLLGLGKSIRKSGEEMKSEALKQREEQRAQKIAEAEQKGTWEAFKTAAGETIKDPALLTSFLAEQVPQMIIPFGAGKAGSAIVAGRQALAGATAKEAALAGGKAGVTTAVGAGGVQQGADVGAQSYEDIYKYLVKDGTPPDQAKSEALNLARASGAGALVISLLAQRLPGAKTLEESFVGVPGVGGKVARIGKGIAGETGSEIVEEGGGKIGQNIAMRQVNPEQSLMEGVGATAGLAAVGGIGMGGIGGALQKGSQPTTITPPETKQTTDKLLSQSQLLLPAPDEQIINDKQYDPLRNPLGNFLEGELTPEQIAYINKDRSDNNKPRLNSYSLEDYVDALRHSSDTDIAKQGALDNILTFKTGYDGMVETTVDQVLNAALDKNIETGTQGFKDFLTRATGTDNLEVMSPVQLYSAYEALVSPNVPRSDTLQILPEGTNATRFTQKQYDQALNNLQAEYNFLDTDSLGRTSVINDIKDTTGLKDDTDAKALLRHAINRGDLEERISTAKVDGKDVNVVNISFAGKSEPLPSGLDIRYQTFKQGAVPENYEIKNGSVVLDRVGTEEEAKVALEKQTAIAEKKALDIEKDIEKIQSGVDRLEYSLDEKKTLGHFGTPAYNRMATDIGAQIRQAKDRIDAKLNDIRNLRNPFAIVPVGEKPVTAKKYVFYDNDTPLASFANKDLAEQYGLMRQNAKGEYAVTDETLQQIIDSAPTTKGTLPKRYASYAKKELARRKGEAPEGIEVRKSMYQPKVEEDFEKIRQNLLPALKKFGLEKVGLRIVKSIADGKADGSYVQELIKIAYNAKNPMGTLRHEVIHALKELGAFTQQEWKILENKAKSEWIDKYIKKVGTYKAYQDAYKQSNGDLKGFDEYIAEEAIAEAFRDFANTKPPVGLIGNLFFRLNKMFEALGNTFKRLGYATAGDIFQKVERGEAKPTRAATSTQEKLSRQKQPISDEEYFAQETARPKAKKVIFEVAPDPNNKDLTERWNSLSSEEKLVISKKVADYVVKDALETFDSEGKISDQIGSYGEFTNPSLSLFVDSGDSIEIAKYLGYALSQDSMVVISPREKKGFDKTGAVVIDVGNKNEKEIDDIYQTLRAINLNGENPVGGQSTINGKMVVLNYSNSTTQDLAVAIDDALKQKYNVATNEVYTAFPEKKDYDYGDKTNDPRGIGRVVRERSRAIRSEAAALIESELKQVGKGKTESASSGINILDKRVDNPNLEKPTVNDVGKYFDGLYDKKRDFSKVEDFNRAVKIATEEIAYQLENERSGLDWYDEDISKAFKLTAKIIPKLKQSNSRFLFSVMAGIMSPQTNARDNWVIAAQNFQNYIKTGKISGVNPQTGGLWQGGTQSINKQKQLDLLNNMVQDMGEKGAIAWLVSNRTVKEINDFRMKYGNIKSGIGGKMTDIVPALYTFGPKVGPFVSNLNGIYDVTVDKWMTRTFNRYFGTMLGKDKNIIDAPTEKQRTAIKNLINEVAKDANIKPYQAQSLLWFFEQRLFRELGTPSPSYGFGDGARKFSEQNTKGGDRGGVEGDGKNKPATQTGLDKGERYQIRAPETKEFKQWFGDSKIVNEDGTPKVMYHGTARDISEFRPKQANAIFVTESPNFAENYSGSSKIYMRNKLLEENPDLKEEGAKYVLEKAVEDGWLSKKEANNYRSLYLNQFEPELDNIISLSEETFLNFIDQYADSFENIMPVFISAKNPFDYSNSEHREQIEPYVPYDQYAKADEMRKVSYGDWSTIESDQIQKGIKKAGFDGFYVKENGVKNLAVYKPSQVKSATGNRGTFDETNPDIRYQIRNIMDEVDPDINSRVGATTRVREEKGFVERLVDAISPTSFAKYRQAFVNKYEAIELLSRQVAREHGSDRLLANTSAIAAALQSDRAAGVAAASFKQGIPVYRDGFFTVDPDTKGLIPILEPLMAYNDPYIFQLFQYYGATRRGKRLDAEGRERTFTKEDVAYGDKLEKQFPEFKQVFNEYQTYNKGLVDLMVDRGVITKEEGRIWTQNWDYIPFYRQMDGETTAGPKVFSSFTAVAKPKELKGAGYYSVLDANGQEIGKYLDPIIAQKKADEANGTVEQVGAPITDFLETVVRNARAAIEASMKNEAANRIIRDTLEMGLAQEVPLGTNDSAREIVTVKQDGKNKYFRVADPLLYESLKGLNTPQMQWLSWLAAPANLLRNFVTKDPGFMIANLGRDSLQAWITSGTDMRPVIDTFKQFSKTLTNSSPEAQALALAGLTGYDFSGDVKGTAKGVAKELRKMAGQKTKLESLTTFWDMLEQGSHASDMATRAEVYKRTLERTKSPEFPNGNEAEAFYQAMEVLNFSRKGNSAIIQIVSAVVPFFNARVQGLDVLYRAGWGKMATENADVQKKAFANRALIMMGLSMAYWFMMTDSDEYKKLSKEERDNYWIIPALSINDKPFRFPIPFELGVVFKVLPERVLETMFGNDTGKDLRESIFRNMTNTLQFNPIPQAFIPIVENVTNHSFFTGENIVGRGMEDLAPQFQYTQSTSQFAKDIGATLGSSPIKIENLIRGYTGTMGTYALQMLDAVYRTQGDDVRASMRLEQMPVIKRFFSGDSGTISAYYDLKQEVNTVVRTLNLLEKSGDIDAYMKYMDENGSLYNMRGYINTIDKNMKQVREARKYINDAKGLSPDEKREQLDSLHEIEISLTENIKQLRKEYR